MAFFQSFASGTPNSSADTIWSGSYFDGFQVQPAGDASADFVTTSPGNDTLWGGNRSDSLVAGIDLTTSATGIDTLYAGGGDDRLILYTNGAAFGEAGNDTMFGGGAERIFELDGGDGNDQLTGYAGSSAGLRGGSGNDRLLYFGNVTTLNGSLVSAGKGLMLQSVVLHGGSGDDYLQSDQQAVMTGGIGVDVFHLSRSSISSGRHFITDFKDGVDKIAFDRTFGSLSVHQSGSSAIVRDNSGMALAQLDNVQASQITLADFVRATAFSSGAL